MSMPSLMAVVMTACAMASGAAEAASAATNTAAPAVPLDLFRNPVAGVVAPMPSPTSVVAVVNGTEIRQSQVNEIVERVFRVNQSRIPAERQAQVRMQIAERAIDDLVTQTLLVQEADKAELKVSPEDIEKAKKEIPMPEGKTLDDALAEQKMTLPQLEAELTRALRIQKVLESKASVSPVSDDDIKKFYEENKSKFEQKETVTARHILIQVAKDADEKTRGEKKAKAEDLRKQLEGGADFAELAKKHSEDPGSKDKGGEYTFPRGMMVKEFEEVAFTQETNKISALVETQFGYHIIQTLRKNPPATVPLEEAKTRIKDFITNRNRGESVQKYIKDLRERAKIEYPGRV